MFWSLDLFPQICAQLPSPADSQSRPKMDISTDSAPAKSPFSGQTPPTALVNLAKCPIWIMPVIIKVKQSSIVALNPVCACVDPHAARTPSVVVTVSVFFLYFRVLWEVLSSYNLGNSVFSSCFSHSLVVLDPLPSLLSSRSLNVRAAAHTP